MRSRSVRVGLAAEPINPRARRQFHDGAVAAGLPALLPLGWSPLAAFDLRGALVTSSSGRTTFRGAAFDGTDATLVTYRPATHAWVVVAPHVAIASAAATLTIPAVEPYISTLHLGRGVPF